MLLCYNSQAAAVDIGVPLSSHHKLGLVQQIQEWADR